jgi:hypothetical protein
MKIAVCLSGQPKFFEKSFAYVSKNLFYNFNELDIFFHSWQTNLTEEEKNKLINLYKPKKYLFENEKLHILNYPFKQSTTSPNNVFSMFYSIKKSNELKKQYEEENNFKYDWVFRLRYDFALNKKFDEDILNTLSKQSVYLNNFEQSPNPHCADCFGFSSSENMNIYSDTYSNIMKYGFGNTILAGEAMLYRQLIANNISLSIFGINHAFLPDYKTCFCPHSLIRS